MDSVSTQQIIQENEYEYPYHYLPVWDGTYYSQTHTLVWGYEYLSYLTFILDKVRALGFESLLDVGCGDGRLLYELSRSVPGKRLTGVDYSQRAIDLARIMAPDVEWICGEIEDAIAPDPVFDTITVIETLEHIEPDGMQRFLQSIHRRLKDNGRLIVTVPSSNVPVHEKHYRHFDLDTLGDVLSPFFTVDEVFYLNKIAPFALKLIERLLSNRVFILNNRRLLTWIYTCYLRRLFHADKNTCRRIAAVCKKNT